mgnify:CR=1 FL=1
MTILPGDGAELNQELEKAGRVADFIELAELMCMDARQRNQSCGGYFREEYQTEEGEALRRRLDDWFEAHEVYPRIVGEFDDSALLKAFGEAGVGIYPAPTVIEDEICRMYRSRVIGRTEEVTDAAAGRVVQLKVLGAAVVLVGDEDHRQHRDGAGQQTFQRTFGDVQGGHVAGPGPVGHDRTIHINDVGQVAGKGCCDD